MEHNDHNGLSQEQHGPDKLKDLEPGRNDRNLLSDDRTEAPIDQDANNTANIASDAGDETYDDEAEGGRKYFERRAGDNVRK